MKTIFYLAFGFMLSACGSGLSDFTVPGIMAKAHKAPAHLDGGIDTEDQNQPVEGQDLGQNQEEGTPAIESAPSEKGLEKDVSEAPAVEVPKTFEETRLSQMGVDYFLMVSGDTQVVLYVRERDQALAEAAIADILIHEGNTINWVLAMRPDSEILTKNGFRDPPPSIETLLADRGITNFTVENGDTIVIYDQSFEGGMPVALSVLAVFYPDVDWKYRVEGGV